MSGRTTAETYSKKSLRIVLNPQAQGVYLSGLLKCRTLKIYDTLNKKFF